MSALRVLMWVMLVLLGVGALILLLLLLNVLLFHVPLSTR
jgi:hypothetical protein